MRKMVVQFVLVALLACFTPLSSIHASVSQVDPFPIGIFVAPDPATTVKYQEIKDMNATYIVNNEGTVEANDASLAQCEIVEIKCVVTDTRLIMYPFTVGQTIADNEWVLSKSSSVGQTFTTTSDAYTAINTIELFIDKSDWTEESKVTLSLYDSTSKTTLLGRSTVTGAVSSEYIKFGLYKWISPNTTYYMELTSDGSTPLKVKGSSSDTYTGGTAYEAGVAQSNHDMWFKINYNHKFYEGAPRPATEWIDEIANRYKSNPWLMGYAIVDEPSAKGMTGLQATMEHFRQADPDHMTYANLLPIYASDDQLFRESHSGDFVSPSQSLGQTFKTNAVTTSISTIQLFIGGMWGDGESITLKLWDSPAKTTLLGEDTKGAPGVVYSYPKFSINATVSPNTTYYWELTHNGGGVENLVGWVVYGEAGSDWEKDGTGYKSGVAMNSDFWFTINQDIVYRTYEDYVYRWANKRPDVLMFDYYPFRLGGGINEDGYYNNLEIIRRQALAAEIDFWSYIQSVGEEGSLRQPNENELMYQVYTNLAYGAKGINYFLYQNWSGSPFVGGLILPDGSKSALYHSAKNINAGVLKLGPTLQRLKSKAVYHTGTRPQGTKAVPTDFFWQPADSSQPMIISSFTNENGRKYVMVVNRDIQNSRMIAFSLPSKPGSVKEVSKITGSETSTNYNSMAGTLSGSFAPGEGKLYVLDEKTDDINVTADLSPKQPDGQNGWYVHPVTLTLSATNVSGVASFEYSTNGGANWQPYSAPLTFGADGQYAVSYRSTHNAGNMEAVQSLTFKVDTTAPNITVTEPVNGSYSIAESLTPKFAVSDGLSGVDKSLTSATLDGKPVQPNVAIPLYTMALGNHTLKVSAVDAAGNLQQKTVTFQVDADLGSLGKLIGRWVSSNVIDNRGIGNSLQQKLDKGNLKAFVQEVQAQRGKHIAADAADILIKIAQQLLSK
ncbi:OmpL47-type beta-barrel domain-containing protein [Cohnella soli]|uniref:OmpL47-type beta-barrel domain-containing protein n=1 Tax=Cohnella soli TaxID=425005 RepID=A0ABW0I3Q7_9BACL